VTSIPEVAAILLDIEGTTTPISFVTEVLFPYARKHVRAHLEEHAVEPEYGSLIARLRDEHASESRKGEPVPPWVEHPPAARLAAIAGFVEWLMDRDRKSTGLKELQGRIWDSGFKRGELGGDFFPDVAPALKRWHEHHIPVAIFSSGSVLAQQLIFRYSPAGDLTPFVRWYFDTNVGAKGDAQSYRRIAQTIDLPAGSVMFLSDVTRELDAARAAGLQVRLVIRPGNTPAHGAQPYQPIHTFDELDVTTLR
jgi:enolase-phosphatase E1